MSWTLLPSTPLPGSPSSDNCCKNVLQLGCFTHCYPIVLKGVTAPSTGTYKIQYESATGLNSQLIHFNFGDPIQFDSVLESGEVRFRIYDPMGAPLIINNTEIVPNECGQDEEISIDYDCYSYIVSVSIDSQQIINEPCSGSETVVFDPIQPILCSRNNASRFANVQAQTSLAPLFLLSIGQSEIYRLYYTPIDGCKLSGTVAGVVTGGSYSMSGVAHVPTPQDGKPYIQFELQTTGVGTGLFPIQLQFSGLCGGCAAPILYNATVLQEECPTNAIPVWISDKNGVELSLDGGEYTVPEDIEKISYFVNIFRYCCNGDIKLYLSVTGDVITVPSQLTIKAGTCDVSLPITFPKGAFNTTLDIEIEGCILPTETTSWVFKRL